MSLHLLGRINRNILECKEKSKNINSYRSLRINRNILECKGPGAHANVPARLPVLIETYWNVKY